MALIAVNNLLDIGIEILKQSVTDNYQLHIYPLILNTNQEPYLT